jgi:hypothetical protein
MLAQGFQGGDSVASAGDGAYAAWPAHIHLMFASLLALFAGLLARFAA